MHLGLLLASCRPLVPLDAVPVVGGSQAQRAAVAAELAAFGDWIGRSRLELRAIVFQSLPNGVAGGFQHPSYKLFLAPTVPVEDVRATLRHELCHALDYREELLVEPDPLWDAVADGIQHDGYPVDLEGDPRRWRSEALAQYCAHGPDPAEMLADGCPYDPPEAADLARWLLDRVWTGFAPALPPVAADPDPANVLATPELVPFAGLEPLVKMRGQSYDLYTGEPTTAFCCTPVDWSRDPDAPADLPLTAIGRYEGPGGGFVTGIRLPGLLPFEPGWSTWAWLDPGSAAPRLYWSDGSGWRRVEGCLDAGDSSIDLFGADGWPWVARSDGIALSWSAVGDDGKSARSR